MRLSRALIENRMRDIENRYLEVTGRKIDPHNGYAQCSKFPAERPNKWTCSPSENAHRLYGEWSSLRDLLEA